MHEPDVPSVEYDVAAAPASDVSVDLLFVPVFDKDDALADVAGIDAATGGEFERARAGHEFKARAYDVFVTPVTDGQWKTRRIAFVGVGARADANAERLRRVAATCAYVAPKPAHAAGLAGSSVATVVKQSIASRCRPASRSRFPSIDQAMTKSGARAVARRSSASASLTRPSSRM